MGYSFSYNLSCLPPGLFYFPYSLLSRTLVPPQLPSTFESLCCIIPYILQHLFVSKDQHSFPPPFFSLPSLVPLCCFQKISGLRPLPDPLTIPFMCPDSHLVCNQFGTSPLTTSAIILILSLIKKIIAV